MTPVVIMLEVGLGDEPHSTGCSPVDVVVVHADTVRRPVGHPVVHVLAVVDAHRCDAVLANTNVGARIQASAADA